MYKIKLLNKISPIGLAKLDKTKYTFGEDVAAPDAIMVRSAVMHDMTLDGNTLCVARAGAGVNNIPADKYAQQGVVVFNTPGANANAVKELVIAGLLMASRKIIPAAEWAKTLKGSGSETLKLVEKGKSQFTGPEIFGKTLGIVGLGAIGYLVAGAACALGMSVVGYDPFLSDEAAARLPEGVKVVKELDELYPLCDYITLHVPANDSTKGMINADSIAKMRDNVRILNFARDALVNEKDLLAALDSGKVARYVTDFPTDAFIDVDNVVAIPHLGASTPESEDNCAVMAAEEITAYIEKGSIVNSVNMPKAVLSDIPDGLVRVCVICKAGTELCEKFKTFTRGEIAYAVADVDAEHANKAKEMLKNKEGVIRARFIEK